MKQLMRILFFLCMVVLLSLLGVYFILGSFYKQHFTFGTYINGYYCAGMTVEEVNEVLLSDQNEQILHIEHINGSEEIPLTMLSVALDYTEKLEQRLKLQSSLLWGVRLFAPNKLQLEPAIVFDEDIVEQKINSYDFMKYHIYSEDSLFTIVKDDNLGYILQDETCDMLHPDVAIKVIIETLRQGNFSVSLLKNNCYQSLPENAERKSIRRHYEKIKEFQNFSMTYHIGTDTEVIDEKIVSDWIMLDDKGEIIYGEDDSPVLDQGMIQQYVKELSEKYSYQINVKTEYDFLLNAFLNHESGEREIALR